ncbi:MAG: CatB-related O-acetyltransferase [Dyella sp.]
MNVVTEDNFTGLLEQHPWAKQFSVLGYADGGSSLIPHRCFRNWLDEEPVDGHFHIGRCSGLGVGTIAKYDSTQQKLVIGRYVSSGLRVRFLLNGQHEIRTISSKMLDAFGMAQRPPPQYGDTVVGNDVWIGDEIMVLGGSTIADGCVIGARSLVPPNFKSAPYGIYAGSPARLIRYRFSEKIREALLALAWWDMPLAWMRANNQHFLVDLTHDEGHAMEVLQELMRQKQGAMAAPTSAVLS